MIGCLALATLATEAQNRAEEAAGVNASGAVRRALTHIHTQTHTHTTLRVFQLLG